MSWVKFSKRIIRSPAVFEISRRLDIDMRIAAYSVMEFWLWFDGNARSYEMDIGSLTPATMCSHLQFPAGLIDEMIRVKLLSRRGTKLIAIDRSWSGSGQWQRKGPKLVYFIKSERTGLIKIGISRDPDQRITELRTSEPVVLLGTIGGGLPIEQELHRQFAAARVHGEWFSQSIELVDFIRSKGFDV